MRRIFALCLLLCILCPAAFGEESVPVSFYEAPKQITVSFVGDCTLGCTPLQRISEKNHFWAAIEENGMAYPFAKVKEYFDRDDLTVVNLESVFYEYEANKADKKYNFRAPLSYAQILPLGGVEAVSFANNHMFDYGVPGYRSTFEALKEVNIPWFGVSEEDCTTYIFEKDGVKIGFSALYNSNWWTIGPKVQQSFRDLKDAGCQVIVGCMHGGVEYDVRHDSGQEWMANNLINLGADIVIGHHPHTLQGIRVENGRTTLWSLGNFVFGGNPRLHLNAVNEPSINTIIAQFTFSFDEDGEYLGHQLNIIPCHTSGTYEYNDYQPCPVEGAEANDVIRALQRDVLPRNLIVKPYIPGVGALQEFVPAPQR